MRSNIGRVSYDYQYKGTTEQLLYEALECLVTLPDRTKDKCEWANRCIEVFKQEGLYTKELVEEAEQLYKRYKPLATIWRFYDWHWVAAFHSMKNIEKDSDQARSDIILAIQCLNMKEALPPNIGVEKLLKEKLALEFSIERERIRKILFGE